MAYAARHQVEVIPEIEMPAHSNAALASYPLLACPVVDKFIGVLPGLGGNHADVIFCAGNDSVFTFLQGVIDEVVELFPSRYIHLGGDEARKRIGRSVRFVRSVCDRKAWRTKKRCKVILWRE